PDLADARGERRVGHALPQPLAEAKRDGVDIERALGREERAALFVFLADDRGLIGRSVEQIADLGLDQRLLFLDHDDALEAAREGENFRTVQRPGAAKLEQAQAEIVASLFVETEVVERLAHVAVSLADGDDADLRRRPAGDNGPVDGIGAQKSENRVALVIEKPRLLRRYRIAQTDVQAIRRHCEIVGDDGAHAIETTVDDPRGLDRVLRHLQRHPAAAKARQRPAVQYKVHDVLKAGRHQHRDQHIDETKFRLVRAGRGRSDVIVAGYRQHAAMRRSAGEIGMAEDVAGAIDARPFAVPHAKDAVVETFAAQLGLL